MADNRLIEDVVADNRRKARLLESYRFDVDQQPSRSYNFTGSTIEVRVTAELYTRPLNNSLVSGHPDPEHGSGRGVAGDVRGPWTQAESVSASSGEFTEGGRETVADALEGAASGLETAVVGGGSSPASPSDTSLASRSGSDGAWGDKLATNRTRGSGVFLFAGYGDVVNEVGLEDGGGDLMARLTTSGVDPDNDRELRVDIVMEFVGNGVADSVITDDGEEAVADSVRTESATAALTEIGIGTGTAAPAGSDSSLANQVGRKSAARDRTSERVRAYIPWYKSEPSGQPHDISEMGVFDNEGRMVFRVTFQPFTKSDEVRTTTGASIRIV